MTLEELKYQIERLIKQNPRCKDNIVGVADKDFKGFGGTPIFEVNGLFNGIDWNSGTTFIELQTNNQ